MELWKQIAPEHDPLELGPDPERFSRLTAKFIHAHFDFVQRTKWVLD